jgi:hypothetical protein
MFNVGFWMMNGGAKRRKEGRAHAKGAEDAERKAGHRLKKMEEDVFAGCGSQPPEGGAVVTMVGGSGFLRR